MVTLMPNKASKYKDLGALQDLLIRACPAGEDGRRSIPRLATHLQISSQYIYRWINKNSVPAPFVSKIISLQPKRGGVTLAEFIPFVFSNPA